MKKQADIIDAAMPRILDGYCFKSDKPRPVAEQEAKEFLKIIEDSSSYMFNKNHAIAYSMVSYLCGYYRYYYPHEFITAFLRHPDDDKDIVNGTDCAKHYGIGMSMPKWGISRATYNFDKEQNMISKGLSSIKHLNESSGEELYWLSQEKKYETFAELLVDITNKTRVNNKQIEILIKTDFFSEFGDQRHLLTILDIFKNTLKKGEAKKLRKDKIVGTLLQPVVEECCTDTTRAGKESTFYTVQDMDGIIKGLDKAVKSSDISSMSVIEKAKNYKEALGYPGYISFNKEDDPKLYITEMRPARNKTSGDIYAYNLKTKSIGSGKVSSMSVSSKLFKKCPVKEDDIIYCPIGSFVRNGKYFNITKLIKVE